MSVTLSPPVRVATLVAALVLTGLGAFVFLLGGPPAESAPTAPVAKPATRTPTPTAAKPQKAAAVSKPRLPAVAPGFPNVVERALRKHRVVVVTVYVPGAAVDAVVRREARAGAEMSRAGFAAISASSSNALQKLVAKTGVLPAPAVVIIRRPGAVKTTLSVVDRETVAAAVAQAKSRR